MKKYQQVKCKQRHFKFASTLRVFDNVLKIIPLQPQMNISLGLQQSGQLYVIKALIFLKNIKQIRILNLIFTSNYVNRFNTKST